MPYGKRFRAGKARALDPEVVVGVQPALEFGGCGKAMVTSRTLDGTIRARHY